MTRPECKLQRRRNIGTSEAESCYGSGWARHHLSPRCPARHSLLTRPRSKSGRQRQSSRGTASKSKPKEQSGASHDIRERSMTSFDYDAPADLFPARSRTGHRPVGYRRFNTAAEAIRYAIEQMPSEFLDGTVMETGHERADGFRIKALYDSSDYPLFRK